MWGEDRGMKIGDNKNNKINYKKLITIMMILGVISADVAPFISMAVETEGVNVGEVLPTEQQELEEEIEDLEVEEGIEYLGLEEQQQQEIKKEEDRYKEENTGYETEEEIELSTEEENDIATMSIEPQSANNYVMAKDSDFEFVTVSQGGYSYKGKYGYFRYKGTDEYVEIPKVIQGMEVRDYQYMFQHAPKTLKGIKSDNQNVRSMFGMFSHSNAETLDLTQLDTSRITSMHGTFINSNTKYVDFSNWDTRNVTNMTSMFSGSKMENIDISHLDTGRLEAIGAMFKGATAKTIKLGNMNTSRVGSMNELFMNTRAESIDLSKLDTGNVTNMSSMFEGSMIKHIDISTFNTRNVKNMSSMFRSARADKITLGNINTGNVTTMEGMFEGIYMDTLDLRALETRNVTTMSRMFRNTNIPNLNISSFNTSKVENMSNMFRVHRGGKLDLRGFDTSNVTNMSHMFRETEVPEVDMSQFNTSKVINMISMFQDSKINKLDLGSFNTMRVTDMNGMFNGARAIEIIVSNFDTSYVTDMSRMFRNTRANRIDLGSLSMASVNETIDMFQGTTAKIGLSRSQEDANKLNESSNKPSTLNFKPKFVLATDEDFIGTINGSFQYIGKDEYVEVPHKIRGVNVTSYRDMFANTSIKGVISTNKRVTDMRGMFRDTTSENMDVSTVDTENVEDMSYMFSGSKVRDLDLRNYNTVNTTNMESMFRNTVIEEIDLGSFDLVKVANTSNMFLGSKASKGYARTNRDMDKMVSSSGKPMGLKFSIWSIVTEQQPEEWTSGNVDIRVNASSDELGVDFVEMVNEPGRNLLVNSHRVVGVGGRSEFIQYADLAPIFDRYGTDQTYSLSLDLKSADTSKGTNINVYMQNGSSSKYNFVSKGVRVTEEFQRFKFEGLTPRISNSGETRAMLAFYGTYRTGNYPIIKNVKVELGDKATPWTPAPEDSQSSEDQQDVYTVYNNGTYIFRATYGKGDTRIIAHTVNNIDRSNPEVKITSSTLGQTPHDVTLYVEGEDSMSGVEYITLPDGTKVNGNKAEYVAKENKVYEFKVTDKAGNTTSKTYTVNNIDRSLVKLGINKSNKEWTNRPINIKVTSEDSATPLVDIEMINSPIEGRNLHKGTKEGWTTWDMPPYLYYKRVGTDILLEEGKDYTYSIDVEKVSKDNVPILSEIGQGSLEKPYTIDINDQNGGGYKTIPLNEGIYERNFSRRENTTKEQDYFAWGLRNTLQQTTVRFRKVKVEEGTKATPWTPAPEDIEIKNNAKTYPVIANGLYTFRARYENGVTSEVTINVDNIDLKAPELKVTGNPTDYTEDDEVVLKIKAEDELSGVKSITLPDGRVETGKGLEDLSYTVTENGVYTFKTEDNLGNKETYTVTVDKIMIPYFFYIYDSNGKPLQGAGFDLLRDGIVHKTSTSDVNGLVDFGKVPPTGKYTVKQIKVAEGYIPTPGEFEVDLEEVAPDFINEQRGKEFPATGTAELAVITITSIVLVGIIAILGIKKKGKN